jgi:hypothetical protein
LKKPGFSLPSPSTSSFDIRCSTTCPELVVRPCSPP